MARRFMSFGASAKSVGPSLCWLVIALLTAGVVWERYDDPFNGHTFLLQFGDARADVMLPEVRAAGVFLHPNSPGYDGQFYAQMAVDLDWGSARMIEAIDNPSYRARRVAMPLLIHLLTGGDPAAAVEAYAAVHFGVWLLLAASCVVWFNLRTWGGWAGAVAVSFAPGLAESVLRALPDAPALLLLGWAAWLVQRDRRWAAAALIALATLVRETSLLGAVMLLPVTWPRGGREWRRLMGQSALAGLPVVIWTGVVMAWLSSGQPVGNSNFAWPGSGLWGRVWELWRLPEDAWGGGEHTLAWMALVGLLTQIIWLVWRRDGKDPWWRLGIVFAALTFLLGRSVWEGSPGAAVRVLAPVFLVFNLRLIPHSRRTWIWWLIGNLGLWGSVLVLRPPAGTSYRFENYANEPIGAPVQVVFGEGWDLPKESWQEYWRWTYDRAELDFNLTTAEPVEIDLTFQLRSAEPMRVTISAAGETLWEGAVDDERREVSLLGLPVEVPRLRLVFAPSGAFEGGRPLFNVRNIRVTIHPRPARTEESVATGGEPETVSPAP